MKTENVKGFKDYLGEDAQKRAEIRKIIIGIFEKYGFEPAETPIVEYEEFVRGSNANDEAVSDIFKLLDKGKRKLALRYEFTFQLKRLMKNQKLPYRRYEIGEVFRDEPVSANRIRQFIQCDADVIGSSIKDEAEILVLGSEILNNLGIKSKILVNSRKLINEIIEKENIKGDNNKIMREIDKLESKCKFDEKNVVNELKKLGVGKLIKIFQQPEAYFKKYEAYKEIEELKKYCKFYEVKVVFKPSLVRGLSYYNGTVFEIKTQGIKETIVAGGSYMIDNTQCTGISFGLDRISSLAKVDLNKDQILIVSLNQDREAIKLCQRLREKGKICNIYYGKPSKALEYANSKKIGSVIFVGEKEVTSGKFKIKDMKSGGERLLK